MLYIIIDILLFTCLVYYQNNNNYVPAQCPIVVPEVTYIFEEYLEYI